MLQLYIIKGPTLRASLVLALILALVCSVTAPPILAAVQHEKEMQAEPQSAILLWVAGAAIAAGVGAAAMVLTAAFTGRTTCEELWNAALLGAAACLAGYLMATIFAVLASKTAVLYYVSLVVSFFTPYVDMFMDQLLPFTHADFWRDLRYKLEDLIEGWLEGLAFGITICSWGRSVWNCATTLKNSFTGSEAETTFEQIGQACIDVIDDLFTSLAITIETPEEQSGVLLIVTLPESSIEGQEIEYVEFEYRTSTDDWSEMPTLDPDEGNRDWYGGDGWDYGFDTEQAQIVYDSNVQVRARASGSFGKMSDWAVSDPFLVSNREIEVSSVQLDQPVYLPGEQAQLTATLADQSGAGLAGANATYDIVELIDGWDYGVVVDSGTLSDVGGGDYEAVFDAPTTEGEYSAFVSGTKTGYAGNKGGRGFEVSPSIDLGIGLDPTAPTALQSVNMAASLSNPDDVAQFVWEFGDGTTGEGTPIQHVYHSPGPYTITLTAYDLHGNATIATRGINVGTAPTGGSIYFTDVWSDTGLAFSGGHNPRLYDFYVRYTGDADRAPACFNDYDVRIVDLTRGIILGTSAGSEFSMEGSGAAVQAELERSVFRTPGLHTVRIIARHANGDTAQADVVVDATAVDDREHDVNIFPASPEAGDVVELDASHIAEDSGGNPITGYHWRIQQNEAPYQVILDQEGAGLDTVSVQLANGGEYYFYVQNMPGPSIDDGYIWVFEQGEIDPNLELHSWDVPSSLVEGRGLQLTYTLRNYGRNIAHYIARVAIDGTTRYIDANNTVSERGASNPYREDSETLGLGNLSLGQHTIQLTLVDSSNQESSWQKTVQVAPNAPPTVSIESISPNPSQQGNPVNFRADASDSDGSIVAAQWRFGDGGTASGLEVTHTYGDSGAYDVVVEVFDDLGASDTASAAVTIERSVPQRVRDLTATTDLEQGIELAWTNPSDSNLLEVVVMRGLDGECPASHSEGTLVFESTSPLSSAVMNVLDSEVAAESQYWYAVFSRNEIGWNDTAVFGQNSAQGMAVDATAPQVVQVFPSDSGQDLPTDVAIRIEFDEPMNRGSVESAFELKAGASSVSGTFSWDIIDREMTFTPTAGLESGTTYAVSLDLAGGPSDAAGNPLAEEVDSTFSTSGSSGYSGDLALVSRGASATASSWGSYGGYDAIPNAAIDGSHETAWGGTQGAGDWLEIDLGSVHRVDNLRIDNGYHSLEYTYCISVDGISWDCSAPISSEGNHYISDPLDNIESFDLAGGALVRYIRIDVLSTNAPPSHIWEALIDEVEAYAGSGGGTPAAFRVDAIGNVLLDRTLHGSAFATESGDVAEWVAVTGTVEPGEVLTLDPANPQAYRLATSACSTLVAGVVSSDPGIALGRDSVAGSSKALLALVGIVPVKVTGEGGPIQPGDLLVSSSTPGHAMRWAGSEPCPCSLVGKALEPMTEDQGVILVLLTAH